ATETCAPDSSVGGTVRTRFGLFKLDNAPLEGKCVLTSTNPSVAKLMKVYTTKRRKDNAKKTVEVPDPPEEKMQKLRIMKNQKERPLEEINQFPVTVGTKTSASNAIVTEAVNYAIIKNKDSHCVCKPVNIDLDNKSEDDEYEKKNLIAQLYLYCEFWPIKEQLKRCILCLKEGA
ncbi:36312_t:CDS:2, partial [Gigaspora margarita]